MLNISLSKNEKSVVLRRQVSTAWDKMRDESANSIAGVNFISLPQEVQLWEDCQKHGLELRSTNESLAIIGIGGSALGAQVIYESLGLRKDLYRKGASAAIHFFDNIDAQSFWDKLERIDNLAKTHWIVVSKSGSTMETLIQAQLVDQYYSEQGLDFAKHTSLVTEDRDSPLTQWLGDRVAKKHYIPMGVGGRFSVLTAVGLLPTAFLGHSVEEMRQGALWSLDQKELICDFVSESIASFEREEWMTLFWSYSDRLKYFGAWVQQLWAESLAKKVDLEGNIGPRVSSPMPCVGANDQHSILQQVIAGARDKFIVFHRSGGAENFGPKLQVDQFDLGFSFKNLGLGDLMSAEVLATQDALASEGISFMEINIASLTPKSLGSLFMFYELSIGVLGRVLNINPFDQPEVEKGKRLTKSRLKACSGAL